MKILALDSSGLVAGVAVTEDDNLLGEYTINYKKTHSQTLLPMLDEVAKMIELDLNTIDVIAVSAATPFNGVLRIGSATAKGLALALNKQIVSVPTVDALAYNLWGCEDQVCPLMDARRQQAYTGCILSSMGMHCGVWQEMDIPGVNYHLFDYAEGLRLSPKGFLLGTETTSTISSRGVYKFPVEETYETEYPDGQLSSYDLEACNWSNLPDDDWMWQDKCPAVIGEFVWTGFDYLAKAFDDEYWPSRSSYFGIHDLAGLPKDRAWLYRSRWNTEKSTLHVLPHWTWKGREGETLSFSVFFNF